MNKRLFWKIRLTVALLQVPTFAVLMFVGTDRALLLYLGWISVLTWIAAEFSAPEEAE